MDTFFKISLWYILIGTVLTAFYDWLQHSVVKNEDLVFTNWERVLLIIGWPIIFLVSLIKTLKGGDDE
jgi:hypothetical protein